MTYTIIQPGNPGDPDPRGDKPVPITGTVILLIAGLLLGWWYLRKRRHDTKRPD